MPNDAVGGYSIGHLRMKYLNEADNAYARGGLENYMMCKRILENFIDTVKDESDAAVYIKQELDSINTSRNNNIKLLNDTYKNVGYLEEKDKDQERELIEINHIHDMKTICWIVANKHGLFYER